MEPRELRPSVSRSRPAPSLGSSSGEKPPLPSPAVESKLDAEQIDPKEGEAATSVDDYSLSVEDVLSLLAQVGITKSKDSVQRYCREGTLNCMKLGMLRRYYATQDSVTALIENLLQDIDASSGTHLQEAASSNFTGKIQLHEAADRELAKTSPRENGTSEELHETVSRRMQLDEGAKSSDLEAFYRDQIRIKDDQLRVKEEQIAAMLERDRETNFLVRELQGLVSKTFNLIPGGKDARTSETGYRDSYNDDEPPNGENGSQLADRE